MQVEVQLHIWNMIYDTICFSVNVIGKFQIINIKNMILHKTIKNVYLKTYWTFENYNMCFNFFLQNRKYRFYLLGKNGIKIHGVLIPCILISCRPRMLCKYIFLYLVMHKLQDSITKGWHTKEVRLVKLIYLYKVQVC